MCFYLFHSMFRELKFFRLTFSGLCFFILSVCGDCDKIPYVMGRLLSFLRSFSKPINSIYILLPFSHNGNIKVNSKISKYGTFRIGLTGAVVGAVLGAGYSIYQWNTLKRISSVGELQIPQQQENKIPAITPSRQIFYEHDRSGLKLTLYQYQTCPFCCKVRAFLDYYGISYDVVEVDPVLRQSIKWSDYKKVPIVVAHLDEGFQVLKDSTMIVSALLTHLKDKTNLTDIVNCYPNVPYVDNAGAKKQDIMNKYFVMSDSSKLDEDVLAELQEERKWRQWTDNVLVHALSPNVYRTQAEALQAFRWFSEVGEWETNFPAWERNVIILVGSTAMWLIGKRLKKRHHLKEDVRQSLYDNIDMWLRAIRTKGTTFMGGETPNLADLSVYGVLSSIEGCNAFQDILDNTNISPWYNAMKEAVSKHVGAADL